MSLLQNFTDLANSTKLALDKKAGKNELTGKEDTSNKLLSVSGGGAGITSSATDTQYPSAKAVYDFVDTLVGNADALLGSGVIS